MISPLMVSSKNVKVAQKRCLGISIENFTGSSLSEQIISAKRKTSISVHVLPLSWVLKHHFSFSQKYIGMYILMVPCLSENMSK